MFLFDILLLLIRKNTSSDFLDICSQVVKTVYASPSRVNFHVDARKASVNPVYVAVFKELVVAQLFFKFCLFQEAETVPAYPDICFAIDDFDSTFDTVVIRFGPLICVVLNLYGQ